MRRALGIALDVTPAGARGVHVDATGSGRTEGATR